MRNEGERGKGGNHPNLNNQHLNQQAVTRRGSLAGKGVGTGQAPKVAAARRVLRLLVPDPFSKTDVTLKSNVDRARVGQPQV